MGYRWKPNKAQRQAYREKCELGESQYVYISSNGPIREGCYVEYWNAGQGRLISGRVVTSSYGADRGQHTFNIEGVLVKGRNLYPSLVKHEPGGESKKQNTINA